MALVFPSNPSVNDTYQVNGRTYVWNGTSWRTVKGGVPDVVPTLSVDNDFSAGGTLHVDSTNNEIGIGTATPSHQLHLTQDLGVDGALVAYDTLSVGASASITGDLTVGGTITVPTPVSGTNDTKVATTAFVGDAVSTAVSGLLDGAPAALDTLNELAAALDDDASYAATITNALSLKLDSSSYTAADVLAKIKTVDGASSGLDADTLDGSHASAFAATSHTHSYADTSHTHSYAATSHTHSYLPTTGGTLSGNLVFSGDSYIQFEGSTADGYETFLRATNPTADRTIYLPNAGGTLSLDGHTHSYAATSHTHSYLSTSGGTVSGTTALDVVTVSNEIQLANGSATDPPLTFSDDQNTGIWKPGADRLGCVAGGVTAEFRTDGLHLADGDWFRSYGSTGWYNGTYGGGMYMIDSSWVRVYNGKNFYVPGSIQTSIQLQSTRSGTGNIGEASLNIGMGNGSGVIACWNSNGYGPLITIGLGEIFYVRNYLNNGWATLQGYLVNHSSIHSKENIVTLGDVPASVGAASNTLEAFDAMEKVRQLRPVSYYWKEQDALPRMPTNADGTPNTRRINALTRLNKIRSNRGMGDFTADYLKHVCGRDCDNTMDNPCFRYNNYVTGKIGFIAQEVGALLPEAAELSEERNEYESVDTLALVAVLTKALQDIDSRLTKALQDIDSRLAALEAN